jgi:4'-phosphopantetheinyl transferase
MERAEVDVWLLPRPAELPPLSWLDDAERSRAAALPPGRAAEFVAGRRLLRAVLGERLGVPPANVPLVARCARCGGPHGQVRVGRTEPGDGPPPCHVSVSRSGPWIAVATAELAVGVDVESVAAVAAAPLADVALSAAERERHSLLPTGERAADLARTWARKEAVLKALGTGLDLDPSSFTLTCLATTVPMAGGTSLVAVADLDAGEVTSAAHLRGTGGPGDPGEAVGAVAVAGVDRAVVRVHDGVAVLVRAGSGTARPPGDERPST